MPTLTEAADAKEVAAKALFDYMQERKKDDGYHLDADERENVRTLKSAAETAHDVWAKAKEDDDTSTYAEDGMKKARTLEPGRKVTDSADITEARPAFTARAAIKAAIAESAESGGLKDLREIGPASFSGQTVLFEFGDPDETEAMVNGGIKTTLLLSDIAPLADRAPAIVPSAQNRVMVADLMASGTTDSNTVTYYEETTFTNAAAETAENTAKPESTLDFTERTDTVRKIATWIPISDEALNDNAQLRSYVEARLLYMVRQREEGQLITGNGTPPNIQGILNRSGIQTQAKGGDPTPDAFFKAMTKVRVTGDADPDGHVIHPNDWQDIRLLRTADGIYIWGSPQDAGPERLWGLPVRVTVGITEGTGLTGAFGTFAQVYRREGLRILASTEHASYFIENKVALLAETRLALAVYRPAAFASVTGI